jgi:hypothetical protein
MMISIPGRNTKKLGLENFKNAALFWWQEVWESDLAIQE